LHSSKLYFPSITSGVIEQADIKNIHVKVLIMVLYVIDMRDCSKKSNKKR